MKHFRLWILLGAGCVTAAQAATEQPVASRIASADLFKNGLAVVRRTVTLPGPGTYQLADVPTPVHGTFWVRADTPIEARVVTRDRDTDLAGLTPDTLQQDLAELTVTIHFREAEAPPLRGRVLPQAPDARPEWLPTYAGPGAAQFRERQGRNPRRGTFLLLKTDSGLSYAERSRIARIDIHDVERSVRRPQPVLLLVAGPEAPAPVRLEISYLAQGLAWAPSYRIDITDPAQLIVEQQAVLRNGLEDLDQARLTLISGFPNVEFARVRSPLAPTMSWKAFFKQLESNPQRQHAVLSNAALQQRVSYQDRQVDSGLDLGVMPMGEGVDLHYQDIGLRTLALGESTCLQLASASAEYERVVEWVIPDTRDVEGRWIRERERERNPAKYQDAAWDAVRFRNPLPFPMTTAPALIVADGRFNGQKLSYWVNHGERTTLKVTKSLSLHTRHLEHEEDGERDLVVLGGYQYRNVTVRGQLQITNRRNEAVKLLVRRRFSGELLEADLSPRCGLLEEGAYSVNKRNQLDWQLELEPGAQQEMTYRYTVLVRH